MEQPTEQYETGRVLPTVQKAALYFDCSRLQMSDMFYFFLI